MQFEQSPFFKGVLSNVPEALEHTNHSKVILFDMDGTLLNSEPLHALGMLAVLDQNSRSNILKNAAEIQNKVEGKADPDLLYTLIEDQVISVPQEQNIEDFIESFIAQKTEVMAELLLEIFNKTQKPSTNAILKKLNFEINLSKLQKSLFIPEITDWLEVLKQNGKHMSVVTACENDMTHNLLTFFKLDHYFDMIITRQSTEKTKPHPRPYLFAIEEYSRKFDNRSIKAQEVLIFEDSHTGLSSALGANLPTYQVKWYEDAKENIFNDLKDRTP